MFPRKGERQVWFSLVNLNPSVTNENDLMKDTGTIDEVHAS